MDTNGNDNLPSGASGGGGGGGVGASAGVDLAKSPGSASGGGGVELGKRGLPKLREIIIRNREDSEVSLTGSSLWSVLSVNVWCMSPRSYISGHLDKYTT